MKPPWTHQPGQRGRVRGIIETHGVGFSRMRGEDGKWEPWQLSVRMRSWRFEGEAVETQSLYLWKRAWLPHWLTHLILRPGRTVAFRVERDASAPLRAKILGYRGQRHDDRLTDALKAWRDGRTLTDPRFGHFTFHEGVDWFETETEWRGAPVRLMLMTDEKAALARAHRLFDDAEAIESRALAVIVRDLLGTFNDAWRDEDKAPYSAEAFAQRMTLDAILIDGGTFVEFQFRDGDLFAGHFVVATFDEEEGEAWAKLEG